VITAIDGQPIEDRESLGYRLATKPLGGVANLTVLRNNKELHLSLKLVPAPEVPARDPVKLSGTAPFSGLTAVNLSPAVGEEFSLQNASQGVVVSEIEDGSPAAEVNFQKGDVIISLNDVKIGSTRDLQRLTAVRRSYWKLTILRGGEVVSTVISG
jgi:S1-C subfamily serine protease